MNSTPRLKLPFITPGQAQKDLVHNEALQLIDLLLVPAVETPPLNTPPPEASIGECYLVGFEPTGDWAGHAHALAGRSGAGWRFAVPHAGMSVFVRSAGVSATFRDRGWDLGVLTTSELLIEGQKVVGRRASSIASPIGGRTIDGEARTAIDKILEALRGHGLIET